MAVYSKLLNRFQRSEVRTPLPLASRAVSGNSGQLDAADFITFDFNINVTVAGTTLNVAVEESTDGVTWTPVANVNQNAVGAVRLRGQVQRKFYRVVYTITGAAYTFSVIGDVK